MPNTIHIKLLSENAYLYLVKNISKITVSVINNDNNRWIFTDFPQPMFVEKRIEINDFELESDFEDADKEADFRNSIKIFEALKSVPRYILCDEKFWLWLHFEKFYPIVKSMMKIRGESTIKDHWMHVQGTRRGLMFGVLSRCFFRVALTIDESNKDNKYELTNWIIHNPQRFRELSWRSFSSEAHLVRGIVRAEKRAIEENPEKENNDIYPKIGKYVSLIGSVRLLDIITEEDIESMIYEKTIDLLRGES
jgi:hypothetical protein